MDTALDVADESPVQVPLVPESAINFTLNAAPESMEFAFGRHECVRRCLRALRAQPAPRAPCPNLLSLSLTARTNASIPALLSGIVSEARSPWASALQISAAAGGA